MLALCSGNVNRVMVRARDSVAAGVVLGLLVLEIEAYPW